MDGYRIKIHFGIEKEVANNIRSKFSAKFSSLSTYQEYQQPNWVVLVGDFRTKLEAFEALKKIQNRIHECFYCKRKSETKNIVSFKILFINKARACLYGK